MIISLIASLLLFSLYTSNVECKPDYVYRVEADAWFKVHKVTAKWMDAFFQCYYEGAVLASPTNEVMLNIITELQGKNDIFIGTHSINSPGQFVSVEGVNIDNMPMTEMIEQINSEEGNCLKMNALTSSQGIISAVPCYKRLPYICYKNKKTDLMLTQCGTFDTEYKFEPNTGSCYKFHNKPGSWEDANSMCVTEGGYLVILNDEDEANTIANSTLFETQAMFVGLRLWKKYEREMSQKDTWISVHGEPMHELYNKWTGSYNNAHDGCGTLTKTGYLKINDCNSQLVDFVCEKDPHNIRFL